MSNKFSKIAAETTTLSPLMNGRTKTDTKSLMTRFPDGVTIVNYDYLTMEDKNGQASRFTVCVIAEDPTVFFFGGSVLLKICDGWTAEYQGDVGAANADLDTAGGVKMVFASGKTRHGNNITTVNIVG